MREIFSYTEKGLGSFNEDIVNYYNNVAWVIDGATPLFNNLYFSKDNDVVWMVNQINDWLPKFINDTDTLEDILFHTVHKVQSIAESMYPDLNNLNHYELPTFTVIMVRIKNNLLEYYILGDCGMLVEYNGSTRYITDSRIEKFSLRNKNEIENIKNNGTIINKDSRIKEILQETRKLLNTSDGYWIGSIDGKGITHGLRGSMVISGNTRVLCFSDGYSRLFELYNLINIEHFKFNTEFIKTTIKQIREIENKDSECLHYPRSKPCDDLSVILIENN